MTRGSFTILALALVLLEACNLDLNDRTLGEKGRVSFGRSCRSLLTCPINRPLATTAVLNLVVSGKRVELPPVRAASSAEGVLSVLGASVTCEADSCSRDRNAADCVEEEQPLADGCPDGAHAERASISVRGESAGNATLSLGTLDGELFDRIQVEVRDPESIRIACRNQSTDTIELVVEDSCALDYAAFDGSGEGLIIASAATLSVANPNVATLRGLIFSSSELASTDNAFGAPTLEGIGPGRTQLSIELGDVRDARDVVVRATAP